MFQRASWWRTFCVRAFVLCIAITFALCLNILPPFHIVSAATNCQGYKVDFDGAWNPSESNDGAGATINTMTPALCTQNASWADSSIWAMTAGQGAGQYAQSGYDRYEGQSTVYFFAEYDKNSSTPPVNKEFGTASGTHTYDELYNFTGGFIQMEKDNTTLLQTNFDPIVEWSSPWSPQFFGETHDPGDDIAGTSSSPVYFSNLCIVTSRSGGCSTTPSLSTDSDLSRYHVAWDNQNQKFHVWT
jgi:hypothetical protein